MYVEVTPGGPQLHPTRLLDVATSGALEHPRFILLLVVALLILLLLNAHGASTAFRFHLMAWLMAILVFLMRIVVVSSLPAGDRRLAVPYLLKCSSMILEALALAPTVR